MATPNRVSPTRFTSAMTKDDQIIPILLLHAYHTPHKILQTHSITPSLSHATLLVQHSPYTSIFPGSTTMISCRLALSAPLTHTHMPHPSLGRATPLSHTCRTPHPALTIHWCLSREHHHDQLQVGSLCPDLSQEWLHIINPLNVALEERVLDHRHPCVTADAA